MQEICETWKLRTPNDWEPVHWWSQLLSWRNQVAMCLQASLIFGSVESYRACNKQNRSSSASLDNRMQVYNLTIRQFGALQSIAPNMRESLQLTPFVSGHNGVLLWSALSRSWASTWAAHP